MEKYVIRRKDGTILARFDDLTSAKVAFFNRLELEAEPVELVLRVIEEHRILSFLPDC